MNIQTYHSNDAQVLYKLMQEWIEVGFSPKDQTREFKFKQRLAKFYNRTPGNVVLFDNADTKMRIATSVDDYGNIWDEFFPTLQFLDNKLTKIHQLVIQGDLAVSVFGFDATFVTPDGKKDVVPTLTTLVWQRTTQDWEIIHEHGTALKPIQS